MVTFNPQAMHAAKVVAHQEEQQVETLAWLDAIIDRADKQGRHQRVALLTEIRRVLQKEAARR